MSFSRAAMLFLGLTPAQTRAKIHEFLNYNVSSHCRQAASLLPHHVS